MGKQETCIVAGTFELFLSEFAIQWSECFTVFCFENLTVLHVTQSWSGGQNVPIFEMIESLTPRLHCWNNLRVRFIKKTESTAVGHCLATETCRLMFNDFSIPIHGLTFHLERLTFKVYSWTLQILTPV